MTLAAALRSDGPFDPQPLRYRLVAGTLPAPPQDELPDLESQLDDLTRAHAGQSALALAHAALCAAIARGVNAATNTARLRAIWRDHGAFLCAVLDENGLTTALSILAGATAPAEAPPDAALIARSEQAHGPAALIHRELARRQQPPPLPATLALPPAGKFGGTPARAAGSHAGYVLLNDTARLSGGFHCGTVMACDALRDGMAARGLAEQGWINDPAQFDRFLNHAPQRPRLLILNGEGTLHHNTPRAIALLECCARARAAGIPVAVINAVWQGNGPRMGRLLARGADLVHVRDTASAATLPGDVAATVTPDMSLHGFARLYTGATAQGDTTAIIDNVRAPAGHALQHLAARTGAAFYAMPYPALRQLTDAAITDPTAAIPRLLTAPMLTSAPRWITGRFHGLIAALAAGRKICAIPSNTHKIEALLADANLSDALLPAEWETLPPADQDARIATCFARQTADFDQRRAAFIARSVALIEAMFDQTAALALPR